MEINSIIEVALRESLATDDEAKPLLDKALDSTDTAFTLDNGLLLHKKRYYVPSINDLRLEIARQHHDSPLAGHPGRRKTYELIRRTYWWPKLETWVNDFVDTCTKCQLSKARRHKPYGELKSLSIPPYPFSSISMDFIVELPSSDNCDAILVVTDRLTVTGEMCSARNPMQRMYYVSESMAKLTKKRDEELPSATDASLYTSEAASNPPSSTFHDDACDGK
jgi:hypothetical protein